VHHGQRLAVGEAEPTAERDPEAADRDVAAVEQVEHLVCGEHYDSRG
jgi:hypothetical protein